jgi:hypothetical protein
MRPNAAFTLSGYWGTAHNGLAPARPSGEFLARFGAVPARPVRF